MAIRLPTAQFSEAPRKKQPDVPLEQILAVKGQSPIAEAINQITPALTQALKRRAELRAQGNAIAQMAAANGEEPPTDTRGLDPETYSSLLRIKADKAAKTEAAAQNLREEARKNADLQLRILQAQNGYTTTDPTTGQTRTIPGMSGISLKYDANGLPTIDTTNFKPGLKPLSVGGGKGAGGGKDPLSELQNDLDPSNPKSGMAKQVARSQAADRVLTLLDQANNDPNVLQSPEAAASVASLVMGGQGGRIPIEQINHLTPSSLKGDVQKQLSYILNQPRSLGQQEFFKSLRDTAVREKATVESQIKDTQKSRLGRHERTRQLFPDSYRSILQNYGLDPDKVKNGRYDDSGSQKADPLGIR